MYVNPSYKQSSKTPSVTPPTFKAPLSAPPPTGTHDVVIGGVAFESSGRSLVRKDCESSSQVYNRRENIFRMRDTHHRCVTVPNPVSTSKPPRPPPPFPRPSVPIRGYPKSARGRPSNRNMTLTNNRRPYQSVSPLHFQLDLPLLTYRFRSRRVAKKAKYVDKPCPRFTTTGAFWLKCLPRERRPPRLPWATISADYVLLSFLRCLQPRINLHVSTRPIQDSHLLELPSRQLSQQC